MDTNDSKRRAAYLFRRPSRSKALNAREQLAPAIQSFKG